MKKLLLIILLFGCEKEYHPELKSGYELDLTYKMCIPSQGIEHSFIFETGLVDGVMADTDSLYYAFTDFMEADLEDEYTHTYGDPVIYYITYECNDCMSDGIAYKTTVVYKYAIIPDELRKLLSEIHKLI